MIVAVCIVSLCLCPSSLQLRLQTPERTGHRNFMQREVLSPALPTAPHAGFVTGWGWLLKSILSIQN